MLHLPLLLPIIEASSVWDPAPCLDKCPELSEPVALLEALVFSPPLIEAALSGGPEAGYEALRDDQQYSCVAEKLCGTCGEISTCNLGRCINDHVECRRLTDFTSELVKICYCSIGYDIGLLSAMIDPRWSADPPPCESSLPDGTADKVAASCRGKHPLLG
ncbi:hypothetical protein Pmar_PMAR014960 [Perkinsus marinus ATCC 50983]|uniref:Uncharacterized protein n=1 Tax=Perkinsus marinus (strain ATCC 50983 / TXsc) TaxID=423536 RepID=C5LFC7_PERM5|nr:hypothetical protein Pmar_PMAR014960 [Perkinsus marinus ATCC 50983]EER04559.1 hypothetical protein Pmar_PMAR014960 [Perkinsus marinus ATCC 50983]|eukprot:XP_002772743.1 hypothetical protein Pmar_PMAR014960 [Perkinsus marinus ATCC 50983]